MEREITEKQANMYADILYTSLVEYVEDETALDPQSLESSKRYLKDTYNSLKICISQLADIDYQ